MFAGRQICRGSGNKKLSVDKNRLSTQFSSDTDVVVRQHDIFATPY